MATEASVSSSTLRPLQYSIFQPKPATVHHHHSFTGLSRPRLCAFVFYFFFLVFSQCILFHSKLFIMHSFALTPPGGALQSSWVHSEFTSILKSKCWSLQSFVSFPWYPTFSLHSQSQQLLRVEKKVSPKWATRWRPFFFTLSHDSCPARVTWGHQTTVLPSLRLVCYCFFSGVNTVCGLFN